MGADLGVYRQANPVSAERHSADHRHVTMARLRLYALTTVGGLILLYELFMEAASPDGPTFENFVWTLLVIPMYGGGIDAARWQLSRWLRRTHLAAADAALLMGRSSRPAAGSAGITHRACVPL